MNRIPLNGWAALVIVALVMAANLIYLIDISDPNPLGPRSGIASVKPGFVLGFPTIDPNIGFTAQALGHRAMLDLVHGHLPWWNPFEATGMPLAGEMQSGALFPPNVLLLLSNGQLYLHMLLEMLTGISTYLLLRRLRLTWCACLAGAAAFALNGTFSWLQHAAFNPVAFLPLALLGIERARAASLERRSGGWRVLALAGALSFVAGFPETTYLDTVMVVVWFAWRLTGGDLDRSQRQAFAIKAATGAAVAALFCAPLLIAFAEFTVHGNLGSNAGSFASVDLPPQGIAQLLLPYIYGPIFRFADPAGILTFQWDYVGGYVTMLLLLLASWGLLGRNMRSLRIVLAVCVALVFAKTYGQIPLLGHVLGWLPAMAHIQFLRYATPTLELALIVLAALGIDDVIRAPRRWLILSVGIASFVVLAIVWKASEAFRISLGSGYPDRAFARASLGWAAATVLVAVLAAATIRSPRARGAVLAAVVAVDSLAMFVAPVLSAPRSVTIDSEPVQYLKRHLGTGRFFTLGPLAPDYGSYFGLSSVNVNDGLIPANFAAYVTRHLDTAAAPALFTGTFGTPGTPTSPASELLTNLAGYQAAGVSYVLTPPNETVPWNPTELTLVDKTPTTWIYRLAGATPLFETPHARCQVKTVSLTSATVNCPVGATLLYRETSMPGWSATVDGTAVTDRSSGLYQSINVADGYHTVSFAYRPPGLLWGELAVLLGLISFALPASQRARLRTATQTRRFLKLPSSDARSDWLD